MSLSSIVSNKTNGCWQCSALRSFDETAQDIFPGILSWKLNTITYDSPSLQFKGIRPLSSKGDSFDPTLTESTVPLQVVEPICVAQGKPRILRTVE
mmetsp:Transcript_14200/g.21821  ORF Transcript_14200/g.21821 Transcript_14200/m.21821 type:complete len:96 (+) Transcript_14200:545-832(+)